MMRRRGRGVDREGESVYRYCGHCLELVDQQ